MALFLNFAEHYEKIKNCLTPSSWLSQSGNYFGWFCEGQFPALFLFDEV